MTERLTPKKLQARIRNILDTWRSAGFDVGGMVIEGDKITILTTEAAKVELDEFEQWNRKQGAA